MRHNNKTIKPLLRIIAQHVWEQPPIVTLTAAIVVPLAGLLVLSAVILCEPFIKVALGLFSAIYLMLFMARMTYLIFNPSNRSPRRLK